VGILLLGLPTVFNDWRSEDVQEKVQLDLRLKLEEQEKIKMSVSVWN
jgi:hypothetical protein